MGSINKAIIVGHCGRDPELTYTAGGMAICKFSVATTDGWGDKKKTTWHGIVAFDKKAEACGKFVVKGSLVGIIGRIDRNTYEKDGVKHTSTNIIADEVQFLGKNEGSPPAKPQAAKPKPPPDFDEPSGGDEEELPF